MQLEGATEYERRAYDTCLRVEHELPASELATTIGMVLSETGNELQRVRLLLEDLRIEYDKLERQRDDMTRQRDRLETRLHR